MRVRLVDAKPGQRLTRTERFHQPGEGRVAVRLESRDQRSQATPHAGQRHAGLVQRRRQGQAHVVHDRIGAPHRLLAAKGRLGESLPQRVLDLFRERLLPDRTEN